VTARHVIPVVAPAGLREQLLDEARRRAVPVDDIADSLIAALLPDLVREALAVELDRLGLHIDIAIDVLDPGARTPGPIEKSATTRPSAGEVTWPEGRSEPR
jgi:hypothetical protein